jgi:hypothetical protein
VNLAIEERARGRDMDLLINDERNDFKEVASCLSFIQWPISISNTKLEGGLNSLFELFIFCYKCNPCSIPSYLPITIHFTWSEMSTSPIRKGALKHQLVLIHIT